MPLRSVVKITILYFKFPIHEDNLGHQGLQEWAEAACFRPLTPVGAGGALISFLDTDPGGFLKKHQPFPRQRPPEMKQSVVLPDRYMKTWAWAQVE